MTDGLKDRTIKDLQSYSYDVGGQKVTITLAEYDTKSGKSHGGYDFSVSIDVDGINRLTCDDHFSTIADFGIGEYSIRPVLQCLAAHLEYWISWQQFQLCLQEDHLPPRVESVSAPMPIYRSNLAARHIEQLTDEQAWWWMTDSAELGTPEDGSTVAVFLIEQSGKAWDAFSRENKDKLRALAGSELIEQFHRENGLTNPDDD